MSSSALGPINLAVSSSEEEWMSLFAPKKPIWVCNTESTVVRIAKDILSVLIFPIGLARLLHRVVGNVVVPAVLMTKFYAVLFYLAKIPLLGSKAALLKCAIDDRIIKNSFYEMRENWNVQRVAIQVDGRIVDAAIVVKKDQETVCADRWTLLSGGNGQFLQGFGDVNVVNALQSNAVYYNYPGVVGSTGGPSRSTIAKTSRVMLKFLEEQLQAKEVIWYGHSLGGGVQEAFSEHTQKEGVKYCLIKSRTFSHLRKTAQDMFGGFRLIAFLVRLFGWDMSPVASVKNSNVPQIILQTGFKEPCFDGIITKESSLAKALEDEANPKCKKLMIPESHNSYLGKNTLEKLKNLVKEEGFAMQEAAG